MSTDNSTEIRYCIADPTGNITALIESEVETEKQPAVASLIMDRHPEVEQAGFVRFCTGAEGGSEVKMPDAEAAGINESKMPDAEIAGGYDAELRMAGGEFCGNATMSTAALYAARRGLRSGSVRVKASGAADPIKVTLEQTGDDCFTAAVMMPPAISIEEIAFARERLVWDAEHKVPVVRMEGIDHVIVEEGSSFYYLKSDRKLAEEVIVKWCGKLGSECLGIMFVSEGGAERELEPLVYVPGADTMFWENSCASGSTAAGICLASKAGRAVDISFDEPAGRLRVQSDPESAVTVLHGTVKLVITDIIEIDMSSI